jgi:hypothetical protein
LKFKKSTAIEPDINLIPFIDVLLVVLIFLMLTTTWSRFNQMNVSLPSAAAQGSTRRCGKSEPRQNDNYWRERLQVPLWEVRSIKFESSERSQMHVHRVHRSLRTRGNLG